MQDLLIVIAPFILNGFTSFIKKLPPFSNLSSDFRKKGVRALLGVLALVTGLLVAYVTGEYETLTQEVVVTATVAVWSFLAATGSYFLAKGK